MALRATLLIALCACAQAEGTSFAVLPGGAGEDYASADASGHTDGAGLTYSRNFPGTPGAFLTVIGGNGTRSNPDSIITDAFVARLTPNGASVWARLLDFPVLSAVQPTNNGGWDAFGPTTPAAPPSGMQVPVVSAILTAGSAGLYQLTVQLPANVPPGATVFTGQP